jgi:hypothetical protein
MEAAQVSGRRLWFGLVTPVAAWVVHWYVAVYIGMFVCRRLESAGLATLFLVLLTLLGLAATLGGGWVALRSWRALADAPKVTESEAPGREQLMALAGVFVAVVFTLGVIWNGLPAVLLARACEVGR